MPSTGDKYILWNNSPPPTMSAAPASVPNIKLAVYIQYFKSKFTIITDTDADRLRALRAVERDFVALGLPHPKRSNVAFPVPNAAQGFWVVQTNGTLHQQLVMKIRKKKPDKKTLDGMKIMTVTMYEIRDDLSNKQPTIIPPSTIMTLPPSALTAPPPRKRRLSDAFSPEDIETGRCTTKGNAHQAQRIPLPSPLVKLEPGSTSTPLSSVVPNPAAAIHQLQAALDLERHTSRAAQHAITQMGMELAGLRKERHTWTISAHSTSGLTASSTASSSLAPPPSVASPPIAPPPIPSSSTSAPSTAHPPTQPKAGVHDHCVLQTRMYRKLAQGEKAKREGAEREARRAHGEAEARVRESEAQAYEAKSRLGKEEAWRVEAQSRFLQGEARSLQAEARAHEAENHLRKANLRLASLESIESCWKEEVARRIEAEAKRVEAEARREEAEAGREEAEARWEDVEARWEDAETRWEEAEARREEAEAERSEAEAKQIEAESRRNEEESRRIDAERLLDDVRRECKEPFVVPALLDAFVEVCRMGEWVGEGVCL